jgi:hypothetical protein
MLPPRRVFQLVAFLKAGHNPAERHGRITRARAFLSRPITGHTPPKLPAPPIYSAFAAVSPYTAISGFIAFVFCMPLMNTQNERQLRGARLLYKVVSVKSIVFQIILYVWLYIAMLLPFPVT